MASTDATAIPVKNQAYRVTFPIWDADGDLVAGATGLDSEVSKDGGAFADAASEATEIATASGMYFLDLTATEMNADTVAIIVKTSSSGAKTTPIILYPQEAGDIRVNVTYWNSTAVAAPATAGIPDVNVKNIDNDAASASGPVTFPNATLASTTNITGGTITTVTNLTTNNDKTGYSLTAGEHTNIATDTQAGLTAQGYTAVRAGYLDTLNGLVAAIWASVTRTITGGTVTTNNDKTGYALSGAGVTAVQSGLSTVTTAQVNAEVLDVLTVDTFAEPAGAPAATSSLKDKLGWAFKLTRNLRRTTSAVDSVYNDAGAVVDSTAALSDDGTTFTRGEYT